MTITAVLTIKAMMTIHMIVPTLIVIILAKSKTKDQLKRLEQFCVYCGSTIFV